MPIERGLFGTRFVRSGIFIPNALGRFMDGPGGCLIGLIIIGVFFWIVGFIFLNISYGITSVIMPSESLVNNSIYRDSIEDRTEIFTDNILEKQAYEIFEKTDFYKNGYSIKVYISRPYSNVLSKHNIEDFNIWYKSPNLSIVQTTREVKTSVYYGDKPATYSNSNEQIEFIHVAYIRSQMKTKRNNFLIEYEFTPEEIHYLE